MIYALDVAAPSVIGEAVFFVFEHPVATILGLVVFLLLLKVYIYKIWANKKKKSEEKSTPAVDQNTEEYEQNKKG